MRCNRIVCYLPDSYAVGELRINHGILPVGSVKQLVASVKKLRRFNPQYAVVFAFDTLALSDEERKMAEAFLELGATMRPCGLGDKRYIDFVLGPIC